MKYIASKYLRRNLVSHLDTQHEGVLNGRATFRVCGRCGGLGGGCNCSPAELRLPNDRLLEQFLHKLAKKKVKLVKDR